MATCHDVAKYFLSRVREDVGDTISNLKLQKLVYYAQGFSLAVLGTPLFEESIEAWEHGPVVPELYHEYKGHGSSAIPAVKAGSADDAFSTEQLELLEEVYDVYGQFSAWKLRNMTHAEQPWIDAHPSGTISHESMGEFFKTLTV